MTDWQVDETMGERGWWVQRVDYNCGLAAAVAVRHRQTGELRRQRASIDGLPPDETDAGERALREALLGWIEGLNGGEARQSDAHSFTIRLG